MLTLAYDWTETDAGLLVRDVEFMSYVSPEDRPDFGLKAPIDAEWFKDAVKTFADRKAKGKAGAYVFLGHNKWSAESQIIGRIENLSFRDHWLRGDMLITNPIAIAAMKRGELPTRSAEFSPARKLFWGLALIMGQEGHFDEELPDLILADDAAALSSDDKDKVSLRLQGPLNLGADMSIDGLKGDVKAEVKDIADRLAKLEAAKAAPAPDTASAAELAALKAQFDKAKWDAALASATATLTSGKCPLSAADITKEFAEIPAGNDAALAQAVKRLSSMTPMPTDKLAAGGTAKPEQKSSLAAWDSKFNEMVKAGMSKQGAYAKLRTSEPELFSKMLAEANPKNPVAVRDYLSVGV